MKGFIALIILVALTFVTTAAYHIVNHDWVVYRQAERLVSEGSFAKAIPIYSGLGMKGFRGDSALQFKLAGLYEKQADYASALAIYDSLLKIEPGNRAVRIRLARCLTALGRYDEAIAAYKMILGEKP